MTSKNADETTPRAPTKDLIDAWQRCEGAIGLGKGTNYGRHAKVFVELWSRSDGRMDVAEAAIKLYFDESLGPHGNRNPSISKFQMDLIRYVLAALRRISSSAVAVKEYRLAAKKKDEQSEFDKALNSAPESSKRFLSMVKERSAAAVRPMSQDEIDRRRIESLKALGQD